jgi:hypothetical protein
VQVFGERTTYGPPVCPPKLTVGAIRAQRGAVRVTATCDRPCTLVVGGSPTRAFAPRPVRRVIRDHLGGTATLRARTRAKGRARVEVSAFGAPGADASARRAVTLR